MNKGITTADGCNVPRLFEFATNQSRNAPISTEPIRKRSFCLKLDEGLGRGFAFGCLERSLSMRTSLAILGFCNEKILKLSHFLYSVFMVANISSIKSMFHFIKCSCCLSPQTEHCAHRYSPSESFLIFWPQSGHFNVHHKN